MRNSGLWAGWTLAVALCAAGATARAAECRFDRTLTVASNSTAGSLDASTGSGDLRVVAGDGAHVHISGHAKSSNWFGGDAAEVQRICNAPPIEQNGNAVRVGRLHNDWLQHVSVDYIIEVPRSFNVAANSGSGGLELQGLDGTVVATTGSGDIRASHLRAGARFETGSGNVQADEIGGNTKLGTGSGDIHARFTQTGFQPHVQPGEVRATTGSGQIRLENVQGGLFASTGSGDVEASGKPVNSWQIETASGGVKLHLPQGTGFTLDANTASGDIESSLPITVQGSPGKHHLHGTAASGGPEVRVGTASGDIQID